MKRDLSTLDRDICQPLGRLLQEAFTDGLDGTVPFVGKVTMSRSCITGSPGRQLYIDHIATVLSDGQHVQGAQFRGTAKLGAVDALLSGACGLEAKARRDSGDSGTLGELNGVIANADNKDAITTIARGLSAVIDNNVGTIDTAVGVRAFLNNSGTITNGYAFQVDAVDGYPWEYGLYCNNRATKAMFLAGTMIGATAYNLASIITTDNTTISSGTNRGLYISYTQSGTKTGGTVQALGIGLTPTANVGTAYGIGMTIAGCGSAVIDSVCGIWMYLNDVGASATVGEQHCFDLNLKGGNATLTSFIRFYNHSGPGTIDAAFYFANSGAQNVDYLFRFNATGDCIADDASAVASNRTHKIKCRAGGTTFYLNGYAA